MFTPGFTEAAYGLGYTGHVFSVVFLTFSDFDDVDPPSSYWCLVGNGWERRNGIIFNAYYGSFPHSLYV